MEPVSCTWMCPESAHSTPCHGLSAAAMTVRFAWVAPTKKVYVGVGSVAQALDLRGGLGAVFILAIAGGLVEIGLLQKLQNRGGRALAIVTFKTKHIFDSLVKYCTLCRGGQYLPAEPSGCRKAGGLMRVSAYRYGQISNRPMPRVLL